MNIGAVEALLSRLDGAVRKTDSKGQIEWRYHGRLVARQLDAGHLVIRAEFEYRDAMAREFPATFSIPDKYRKHMMLVASLSEGDPVVIEDALRMAWELQRSA